MHLGVNLRKFIHSFTHQEDQDSPAVDVFVYQYCKLFGSQGPEYAVSLQFRDFLMYRRDHCDSDTEKHYYKTCLKVALSLSTSW